MCGISGIITSQLQSNHQIIANMNNLANHRGPDDEGYVFINSIENSSITAGGKDTAKESWEVNTGYHPKILVDEISSSYNVVLAHRRLSILDLSPLGHLPMCNEEANYWITYNGEVYNYIEIRNELIGLGHTFKTQSDTEVVLKSYMQWGAKCVERFEGMFALVIVDTLHQKVFMARDVFGIKPLYYWVNNSGDLLFASEIKQFTVVADWKAVMNKPRAFDYLFYSLTDHTQETLFKNVFQLLPANFIELDLKNLPKFKQGVSLPSNQYYRFNPLEKSLSFEEAKLEFERTFKESVALHLRSDVSIGSALSGGLDSTAIVCEINQQLKQEGKSELQKTFSSIHHNHQYSEEKWMKEVIDFTQVDAHYVSPQVENIKELTRKILWHMDEPYQSQSAYLGYHVFGLASQNKVKVLLNGQGADEYLSGYEEFRMLRWFKMFKKFKWIALSKEFHFYYGLNLKSWITQISKYFSYFFPDNWFEFFSKRSKHYRNYAKIINPLKFQPSFKHPFKSYNTKRKHHKGLILHQLYCSPLPRFLRWEDRNSMAHSIEARVPFLYKPLVNLSLSLPLEYLDGVNQTKKLMVESLRNLLPPAIYARKDKKGFITPEEQWVKEDKQGVFEQLFEEKIGFLDDLIHREATLNYYKTLKSGEIPFDYLYWRLILLGWWVEIFNVEIDK